MAGGSGETSAGLSGVEGRHRHRKRFYFYRLSRRQTPETSMVTPLHQRRHTAAFKAQRRRDGNAPRRPSAWFFSCLGRMTGCSFVTLMEYWRSGRRGRGSCLHSKFSISVTSRQAGDSWRRGGVWGGGGMSVAVTRLTFAPFFAASLCQPICHLLTTSFRHYISHAHTQQS